MTTSIGLIYKQLREDKGLSIRQAAEGIVTPSYLSKIERGENEISFMKFLQLLGTLNISLAEFSALYAVYEPDENSQITNNIKQAHDAAKINQLQFISDDLREQYSQSQSTNTKNLYLMSKAALADFGISTFSAADIEYIEQYLFSVEHWSKYEYVLFTNTLGHLPLQNVMVLSREVLLQSHSLNVADDIKPILTTLLLNIAIKGICSGNYKLAKQVLNTAKSTAFIDNDYKQRLTVLFIEALLDLHNGFVEQGNDKARHVIATFRFLEDNDAAYAFEEFLEKSQQ